MTTYLTIEITIIILLTLLMIFLMYRNKLFHKENSLKEFIIKNKIPLLTILLFIIFTTIRLLFIEEIPYGLNRDEASAGYDAYNILNYGVDRHLDSFPVYFKSWGGGQNALYTYILIPFIYFLGLSTFSVRLPMAIISCIGLIYIYLIFKNRFNDKKGLFALFMFGITPYLIMKSRWGLESNLLPEFIIFMYYNFDKYLIEKKNINLYSFFILAGITTYTYSTTFMILPIMMLMLMIAFCFIKKEIPIKNFLIGLSITALISLPLIIFVCINQFGLDTVHIGFLTIPKLESNRMNSILSYDILNNTYKSILYLFSSYDIGYYNKAEFYSIFYPIISLVFLGYGIIYIAKNYKKNNIILLICMLVPAILLMMLTEPRLNRINYTVIIYLIIIIYGGLYFCNKKDDKSNKPIIILTALVLSGYFCSFLFYYKTIYSNPSCHNDLFSNAIVDISKKAKKNKKNIYLINKKYSQFIYYLFATKLSPYELNENSKTKESEFETEAYSQINNQYFDEDILLLRENSYYVIDENYSDEQIDVLKEKLKDAKIEYKLYKIDYFFIIET